MAFMSSALGSEVGLRLLLSPAASNVIVRSACHIVGVGFPIYSTHKAIELKDQNEQDMWLVYWAAYGCFSVAEVCTDKLLSWFPMYYHAKFVFLVWLQLPNNYGARYTYINLIRPFFMKHQARLDRIVGGTRNDMDFKEKNVLGYRGVFASMLLTLNVILQNKFIISHQLEILAIRNTVQKVALTAYRAVDEVMRASRYEASPPQVPRPDQASSTHGSDAPGSDDESSVAGHPIEDPIWIEVPRDENTRHRPSHGPSI